MPRHVSHEPESSTIGSFKKSEKIYLSKNENHILRLAKYFSGQHAENKKHEFWQRDSLAIHLYSREVAFQKLKYIHNGALG